jgi:hypothetical protein
MYESGVFAQGTEGARDPLMVAMGAFSYVIPFVVILILGHGYTYCPLCHFVTGCAPVFTLARQALSIGRMPCQWLFCTSCYPTVTPSCVFLCPEHLGTGLVALQSWHAGLLWVRIKA